MGIPEKKMKVAKAKKSTHKRGKTVKADQRKSNLCSSHNNLKI